MESMPISRAASTATLRGEPAVAEINPVLDGAYANP